MEGDQSSSVAFQLNAACSGYGWIVWTPGQCLTGDRRQVETIASKWSAQIQAGERTFIRIDVGSRIQVSAGIEAIKFTEQVSSLFGI